MEEKMISFGDFVDRIAAAKPLPQTEIVQS